MVNLTISLGDLKVTFRTADLRKYHVIKASSMGLSTRTTLMILYRQAIRTLTWCHHIGIVSCFLHFLQTLRVTALLVFWLQRPTLNTFTRFRLFCYKTLTSGLRIMSMLVALMLKISTIEMFILFLAWPLTYSHTG